MAMTVYKTLNENDIWTGVVCETPQEARLLLGGTVDVMLGQTMSNMPEYAPLLAAPGKIFSRAYDGYPRVWTSLPEQSAEPC